MKITVGCPTRMRFKELCKGIDSLISSADDIKNIEFILRFDDDDVATMEQVKAYYTYISQEHNINIDMKFYLGERYGYEGIENYWNKDIIPNATGEYVMAWADDIVMITKGWDTEIRQFKGQFYFLQIPEVDKSMWKTPSLFCFPKKWFEIVGHIGLNNSLDRWMKFVGCNVEKVPPIWRKLKSRCIQNQVHWGKAEIYQNYIEGRGAWQKNKRWEDINYIEMGAHKNDVPLIEDYLIKNPNTLTFDDLDPERKFSMFEDEMQYNIQEVKETAKTMDGLSERKFKLMLQGFVKKSWFKDVEQTIPWDPVKDKDVIKRLNEKYIKQIKDQYGEDFGK